ncbi:MAG: lycopene cyclase family protein [Pseudomonadota bacterium]
MRQHVDLAILGGGCAGLSLAAALVEQGSNKQIVIVEPRRSYQHDRTWCFWADAEHAHSAIVSKTWQRWKISSADQVIDHIGSQLTYQQIRSIDFYDACLATVKNVPNVEVRNGVSAQTVSDLGDRVLIETDVGQIWADFVVDTRPRPPHKDVATVWQVFSGGDIETEQPCFDPSTAGLMQNMSSDEHGLKFTYILPYSPHRALIQTTRFTLTRCPPASLDDEFQKDLNTLTHSSVSLQRRERGCLPMGQAELHGSKSARIMRAGQAAGALRASSGYGFLRIQAWAKAVARNFISQNSLITYQPGSQLERKMDAIFLAALARSPQSASDWFSALACQLSGDQFGRFMSQIPSLDLWLKVINALPKTPFVRELFVRLSKADRTNQRVAI